MSSVSTKKFQAVIFNNDGTFSTVVDGCPYTVSKGHINYLQLKNAVKNKDVDKFLDSFNVEQAVASYVSGASSGKVKFENGMFTYMGKAIHNTMTKRVLDLKREGLPFDSMLNALNNLMENSSNNSVEQLYSFLEHKNLPITDDGCFLAYKTVVVYNGPSFKDVYGRTVSSGDYVDKYTRTIRNNVGDVNEMPRNSVDDNPSNYCSNGYHVGALAYAGPGGWYNSSGDVVVLVKVNPRDAVSVPGDHSFQKLRVCRYEVFGLYKGPLNRAAYNASSGDDVYDDNDYSCCDEDFEDVDMTEDVELDWEDLSQGDEIEFTYTDRNGKVRERHVEVDEVLNDGIIGYLYEGDPSYTRDGSNYREFHFEGMEDIHLVD